MFTKNERKNARIYGYRDFLRAHTVRANPTDEANNLTKKVQRWNWNWNFIFFIKTQKEIQNGHAVAKAKLVCARAGVRPYGHNIKQGKQL